MNLTEIQQTVQLQAVMGIIEMVVMVFILIFLVYLMLRLSSIFRKQDKLPGIHDKILEKRITVYAGIIAKLYDILCFYLYTGNWAEITPVDVIRLKRELDKDLNSYAPLIHDDLIRDIQEFNKLCFISVSGWEHDIKIKSSYELRERHQGVWEDTWREYFDTKNVVEATKMKEKYDKVVDSFKMNLMLP
jgi:hypothetical protein